MLFPLRRNVFSTQSVSIHVSRGLEAITRELVVVRHWEADRLVACHAIHHSIHAL